jgi:hypothetical protein
VEARKAWITNSAKEEEAAAKDAAAATTAGTAGAAPPAAFDSGAPAPFVSFSKFINHELIEYSKADLARSIPSAIDGLKPSQRKVWRKGAGCACARVCMCVLVCVCVRVCATLFQACE